MKKRLIILLTAFLLPSILSAQNPIIQTCYTADPAPLVYNDTVFLYTGHDEDDAPENKFLMKDYRLFSSTDMVNWTDRGTPLPVNAFEWSGGDANAAQCIERNGKFYWYVSTHDKGDPGVAIGVAVADNPAGPFKDAIGRPLLTNSQTKYAKHGWDDLDPTVFIDDEGQAYLYWGNNACYWVKLNDDMISYSGPVNALDIQDKRAFGPDFEEAPWAYLRNGLYYLIYASGILENIRYATAHCPTGPWKYRGIAMDYVRTKSGTNHPGIIDYRENSYFFYHKAGLPGGHDKRRSVCVEQFTYNADGTIPEIKPTAVGILKPVDNLNPFVRTEAETMAWAEGVKTEPCTQGGMNLTGIDNGDYIKVRAVDFGNGAKSFTACVASIASGRTIELHIDRADGAIIGKLPVSGTGGWDKWKTLTTKIKKVESIHDLYFVFRGKSKDALFKWDYWLFNK
jgi:hypothetical protein